jgi:D-alanyl-D-alanine carboxypeptidase/D-alanyl-D-alanine-endopeptidase (penicillin-binding protein 4)
VTVPRRLVLTLAAGAVLAAAVPAVAVHVPLPIGVGSEPLAAAVVVRPAAVTADDRTSAAAAALGRRVAAALGTGTATTIGAAVDVDGLGVVLRSDAGHALPPASTQKSFTAVAALMALPHGFRFTTEVATRGVPRAGRLPGSLWLVGGGDPYLTRAGLRSLAHSVRAAGIRYVAADLLLDDSRFDARRHALGWKPSYVPDETGPLSALAVDHNTWRHDRRFLADPALPDAVLFRRYLAEEGVTVHGAVRRMRRPADARTVAVRRSGPLAAVLRRALKASDNFAAEMVLKEVGRVVRADPSSAGGHAAVRDVLAAHGVAAGRGTDGSGLSRYDRQTPAAQLALLQLADTGAPGAAFRATLPIACQDGTLHRRMCHTPAAGRVFAKTGTLPGVRALSGYTRTATGRRVWFSFQLTGVRNGAQARLALDRAAIALASAHV